MIVVIDYGMGNLKSVVNALKYLNIDCKVSNDIKEIEKADKLILPGVGAFKDAMDNLKFLIPVIKKKVNDKTPILGICLGMQMLFEKGFEGEERKGLGFIKGEVRLMSPKEAVKIPHIGWNNLFFNKENVLTKGLDKNSFVYFVHSYMASDIEEDDLVSYSEYGGIKVPALVCKDNVYGAQFHPEKSGNVGLKILENFGEMVL